MRDEPLLAFDLLGLRLGETTQARLTLAAPDRPTPRGGFTADVRQAGGYQPAQPYGAPFWSGKEWQAQFRIDRLDPGAGVLAAAPWIVLVSSLVAVVATLGQLTASPRRWMIAGALEYLLAVRILVAVGGAYVDGGARAAEALPAALAAFAVLPLLLAAIPGGAAAPRWLAPLHAAFALAVTLYLWRAGAGGTAVKLLGAAAFVTLLWRLAQIFLLPSREKVDAEGGRMRGLAGFSARLRALLPTLPSTPHPSASPTPSPARGEGPFGFVLRGVSSFPRWALILLSAAIVIRLGLGVFSLKESLTLGGVRLSLSLIYLPALLVGFGALLAAARDPRVARDPAAALVFLVLLTAATAVVPFLIQDNGFVIFALPMALAGWIVHWRGAAGERRALVEAGLAGAGLFVFFWIALGPLPGFLDVLRLPLLGVLALGGLAVLALFARTVLWATPALAAVMLLAFIQVSPKTDVAAVERIADSGDLHAELALLRRYASESQNSLRILNVIQPDRVHETGTRVSEDLVAAMAHLQVYTRPPPRAEGFRLGLFGRGFLNLEPPTVLMAYHFNDNVSAIHLIAPFGRAGAAAFLAVLWTLAALQMGSGPLPLAGRGGGGGASADVADVDPDTTNAELTPPSPTLPRKGEGSSLDPGPATERASSDWRPAAASLALWTIALVAAYMILANLQFAPFTGKNVYFLAATSLGDLAEGTLLLAMALWLGGGRRD